MGLKKFVGWMVVLSVVTFLNDARADFLGLAPGDYTVTLNNSSSFCGGSNCTGTVHIGPTGPTDFDWNFLIGADAFEFDGPGISTTQTGLDCALESNFSPLGLNCSAAGLNGFLPLFALVNGTEGALWNYGPQFNLDIMTGSWSAVSKSIPEPTSIALLLSGICTLVTMPGVARSRG